MNRENRSSNSVFVTSLGINLHMHPYHIISSIKCEKLEWLLIPVMQLTLTPCRLCTTISTQIVLRFATMSQYHYHDARFNHLTI